jgi:hypothetical protein
MNHEKRAREAVQESYGMCLYDFGQLVRRVREALAQVERETLERAAEIVNKSECPEHAFDVCSRCAIQGIRAAIQEQNTPDKVSSQAITSLSNSESGHESDSGAGGSTGAEPVPPVCTTQAAEHERCPKCGERVAVSLTHLCEKVPADCKHHWQELTGGWRCEKCGCTETRGQRLEKATRPGDSKDG